MFYTAGIDVGCSSIKAAVTRFDDSGKSEELVGHHFEKLRKRNTKDVITDPNTFVGDWANVFTDTGPTGMPQVLSYEWGISTTAPIRGIPDRSPGGWQIPLDIV